MSGKRRLPWEEILIAVAVLQLVYVGNEVAVKVENWWHRPLQNSVLRNQVPVHKHDGVVFR
jgi:hypothetical protein